MSADTDTVLMTAFILFPFFRAIRSQLETGLDFWLVNASLKNVNKLKQVTLLGSLLNTHVIFKTLDRNAVLDALASAQPVPNDCFR